jgi:hypothetical protein
MKLSSQALQEFKECYQKRFGVVLDDEEANEKGIDLLNFFRIVYRPMPKNYYENEKLHHHSQ